MIFTVLPPAPTIISFSPTSGNVGDMIAISGSNFTDAISVRLNGVAAAFTVQSATEITATVPDGCSSGLISVETPGGVATSSAGFTVNTSAAIQLSWQDEGNTITTQATAINFVGAGVVASNAGGVVTVNISGSGGTSPTPPTPSNVVLLLHLDGANNSTNFVDSSSTPKTITANGDVHISTSQSKSGGASAYFPGSEDYLSLAPNVSFDFNGNFSINLFVRFVTLPTQNNLATIMDIGGYTSGLRFGYFNYSGGLLEIYLANNDLSFPWIPTINTWYQLEIKRTNSILEAFVDGIQLGSYSNALSIISSSGIRIGRSTNPSTPYSFNGYLDEISVTKN